MDRLIFRYYKKISCYLEEKPSLVMLVIAASFASLLSLYWYLSILPVACRDCSQYSKMASLFSMGQSGAIEYPFNLRIGAPWLASLISRNSIIGFVWLNFISILFFILFWFQLSKRLQLRNVEFLVLVLWFFLHPLGFKFYAELPVLVDPLYYAFLGLITLLFISERRLKLWLVMVLALLVKESFVFISLVIMSAEIVYALLTRDKRAKVALLSAVAGVLVLVLYKFEKNLIQRHLFSQSQSWEITSFGLVKWWAIEAYKDPRRVVVWIGSFFCATGVFSALAFDKNILTCLKDPLHVRQRWYFFLGSAGFVILGLLGGGDMSRIIFNGNLLFMTAVLWSFRSQNLPLSRLISSSVISIALALSYTRFFPVPFEHSYFVDAKQIGPIAFFILSVALIVIFLAVDIRVLQKSRQDSARSFAHQNVI